MAVVGWASVGFVEACDYCLISQGLSPLDTVNGRGVRLTQRYTELNSVYEGEEELANPGAEELYYTTELAGFWLPFQRLTVLGVLPLRVTHVDGHLAHGHADDAHLGEADEHAEDPEYDGAKHEHSAAPEVPGVDKQTGGDEGIGDLSFLLRFKAFERHTLEATTTVAILGGIKAPTGATDGRADDGSYLDAHLQLGTGATDGLFGLAAHHVRGRWSLAANLLAAVKGEGEEAGHLDYEYGDSVNYDFNLRCRVWPALAGVGEHQTFMALELAGELRDLEHAAGLVVEGTGGHVVFIQPGLQHYWGSRVILELSAQVPVHHSLLGTQLGDDLKLMGGVTLLF